VSGPAERPGGTGGARHPRALVHDLSTRVSGPRRGCKGFSWIGDERIAIGSLPVGRAVWDLSEQGITHAVNCRAGLQTHISQDLWALRRELGSERVAQAPMWDSGRPQPARLWAPAVEFALTALEDPGAGVLIHCQQGRRRSAMVTYAVLRVRGHGPDEAARLILTHRPQARLVPVYTAGVERWLTGRTGALQ
jgi:protein-tyrosine phosphatase